MARERRHRFPRGAQAPSQGAPFCVSVVQACYVSARGVLLDDSKTELEKLDRVLAQSPILIAFNRGTSSGTRLRSDREDVGALGRAWILQEHVGVRVKYRRSEEHTSELQSLRH